MLEIAHALRAASAEPGVNEAESTRLCRQIGVWPLPRGHAERLVALRRVAPVLLQLHGAPSSELGQLFVRWKLAVQRADQAAAAHWLMRLRLWPPGLAPEH